MMTLCIHVVSGVLQLPAWFCLDLYIYIYKYKNNFTKILKDVGIEVLKSIETRSKCSMHADKGRGGIITCVVHIYTSVKNISLKC